MTAIKGDVGKVMFHNAAWTEADVGQTRSWSLSVNKDTLETAIVGCLNTLGEDKVINLLQKCDFASNIFEEGDIEEDAKEMEGVWFWW